MENDGPTSRVERTLWTLWSYVTEAVNRFFRPEPTNIVRNDPNSFQEYTVDNEPTNSGKAEGDFREREVDEEQPLATACVLGSSRPVVAWELCTTDIDLEQDEESMQHKPQLTRGSEGKASVESEGTKEEQLAHTGNDDAGPLAAKVAQEDEQEESVHKSYTGGQDDMLNDKYEEHVHSSALTDDAMSQDVWESEGKAGAKEETEMAMAFNNHQKMAETMTKSHGKEDDCEKHCEDEQNVKSEDTEVQLCTITYLTQEEENTHMEASREWRDEADTAVTHNELEDSDGVLLLASKNQNKSNEEARQVENELSVSVELPDNTDFKRDLSLTALHDKLQMSIDKSSIVSVDALAVDGQDYAIPYRSESDKVEDAKEEDDEGILNEKEQDAGIEGENVNETSNNQTTDEVLELYIMSLTEDGPEREISTGFNTCDETATLNAKTEPQRGKFTVGEQEDVSEDTEVQTKTTEADDVETEGNGEVINEKSDMTTTDISVDERLFDKVHIEEQRLSTEAGNVEGYMEEACITTSVTIKPEGETGQEISKDFKNIPLGIREGQLVESLGLNSPTCEETQEGVPEYNNEPGPDENKTQRFLEVGDCKEIQTTQLPEEEGSKESESLQNSHSSTGTQCLLVREHMEEEQDSRDDIKNSFDAIVEENVGILRLTDSGLPQGTEKALVEPEIQESALSFEKEEGILLNYTMKTGLEDSEKEFEIYVSSTDETDKTMGDESEELLIQIDKELCDFRDADVAGDNHETTGAVTAEEDETLKVLEAELQKETDVSSCQKSIDAKNWEKNSCKESSLLEDVNESGFLKQSIETGPKLLEDGIVEMQDAGIEMQGKYYKVEEEVELTTERNTLTTEYESLETQNQLSEEALEIGGEEMFTDTVAPDESMTTESKLGDLSVLSVEEIANDVTETEGSYAKESVSQLSGHQDVIDEEILDLWIQTTLSEETDDVRQQEGAEPGQQTDIETELSNEEQDEETKVETEKDKEDLVKSNLGESDLVSEIEISSSTVGCGFLDQSLCEWGAQTSETDPLTLISTGSFQGICDMLAKSADISEMSSEQRQETDETGQMHLKEEESITDTEFHPDLAVASSEARQLDQESDKSQEKNEESGSKPTDLERKSDTEEANVKSQTETKALFKVDETEVEDEPLEITVSDSPDRIEHTESGQSQSGSETSLDEGIMSIEYGSQGDTCTVSETNLLKLPSLDQSEPGCSGDIDGSLPAPNSAEVAEQPTTESEDQIEVDTSGLDFTVQRSRIAVKNPRVRPPKNPRSLLQMPSVDPTPSSHLPVKIPAGVPLGGIGIGIKLPGLGAGFPVLKKTQRGMRDENSQDTQEPAAKPEEKSDTPKQDEAPRKPKWMPPRHPGFGNPLMSELKTKLKKPTNE